MFVEASKKCIQSLFFKVPRVLRFDSSCNHKCSFLTQQAPKTGLWRLHHKDSPCNALLLFGIFGLQIFGRKPYRSLSRTGVVFWSGFVINFHCPRWIKMAAHMRTPRQCCLTTCDSCYLFFRWFLVDVLHRRATRIRKDRQMSSFLRHHSGAFRRKASAHASTETGGLETRGPELELCEVDPSLDCIISPKWWLGDITNPILLLHTIFFKNLFDLLLI